MLCIIDPHSLRWIWQKCIHRLYISNYGEEQKESLWFTNVSFKVTPTSQWTSQVVQSVKNLPAMQKTPVQFRGWEDPLEKGKGYPLQYCGLYRPWGHSRIPLSHFHFHLLGAYSGAGTLYAAPPSPQRPPSEVGTGSSFYG